ncbi:MAG: hypothetical protein LBK55_02995 [Azoarcus sp.]|jgi:hypothetical protein|nr:hypothetical protein [Azoarcus sp.]
MAVTFAAYGVYYYEDQDPEKGRGMVGRIVDSGSSTVPAFPGLRVFPNNGDPKVEGFIDTSNNLRIATVGYVKGSAQPVEIFNALTGVSAGTPSWSSIDNLYSLVRLGNYLYAIDFDNARVVEIRADTYAQTGVTCTLPAALTPSGYIAHGQALIVIGTTLYGLFSFTDNAWANYANSLLVRFTVTGGSSISVGTNDYNANLAKNAFSLAVNGNDLYIAAIGGRQVEGSYNANSRLQKIAYATADLTTATVTDVFSPSTTYPYEVRDISFKGGKAFILMGAYNSNWKMTGKLLSTSDFLNFATVNDFSSGVSGYFWAAQYTGDNDRLWFAQGNDVKIYDASNESFVTAISISTLAGGGLYDNLNDLAYVGAYGQRASLRGYRSPLQASLTPRARAARALTRGRPELSEEEFAQLPE